MLHTALTAGIPWETAWDMTVDEITLAVHAKQQRNKEHAQTLAWIIYNNAALTGVAINNPAKFPSLENAFPGLFERQVHQDWRVMKERMEEYAKAKNL
ncbi:MAG: hypothetical protein FWC77_04180 [Defluviitaleaceae bacterium]|nr:hypothetical protein [Defluviitaleaceae bacterium]